MLPSTSSRLRQGPTHVTDTGRCPMPCPNPIEVARLGQLFLCCSRSGASPSSQACSVLFPALRLSCTAVCAATELSVCCSQDLSDLRTISVPSPDWRGEPVVTEAQLAHFRPKTCAEDFANLACNFPVRWTLSCPLTSVTRCRAAMTAPMARCTFDPQPSFEPMTDREEPVMT